MSLAVSPAPTGFHAGIDRLDKLSDGIEIAGGKVESRHAGIGDIPR